jgi:hypothetical protein
MNEIRDGLVGAVGNTPLIRLRGALVCENGNPVGKPRGRYLHRPTA